MERVSFVSPRRSTLRSRGNKTHCLPLGQSFLKVFCYTSQLEHRKKCEEIVCLAPADWQTCRFFNGARPDHVWVESSSCCFPRELLSFDPRHVTRSRPIGKRIWVGRYGKCCCYIDGRFCRHSTPFHWPVHGHLTCNNGLFTAKCH